MAMHYTGPISKVDYYDFHGLMRDLEVEEDDRITNFRFALFTLAASPGPLFVDFFIFGGPYFPNRRGYYDNVKEFAAMSQDGYLASIGPINDTVLRQCTNGVLSGRTIYVRGVWRKMVLQNKLRLSESAVRCLEEELNVEDGELYVPPIECGKPWVSHAPKNIMNSRDFPRSWNLLPRSCAKRGVEEMLDYWKDYAPLNQRIINK